MSQVFDSDEPLTMLRLEELLFGQGGLFTKIEALTDIVEKGVLDYVAHTHKNAELNVGTQLLLKLAVDMPGDLPYARLNLDAVKPADRATYLLNYLYMSIQGSQLLVENWQQQGCERLNVLKECFLCCLRPYMQILSDWVCKGDDELSSHDFKNEFFIKANHRLFVGANNVGA